MLAHGGEVNGRDLAAISIIDPARVTGEVLARAAVKFVPTFSLKLRGKAMRTTLVLELDVMHPDDATRDEVITAVNEYLAIRRDVLPLPIGHLAGHRTVDLADVRLRVIDKEQRLRDALE